MTFVLTFVDMALYSSGMEAKDMIGYLVEMVDCPAHWGMLGSRGVVSEIDNQVSGGGVDVWWLTGARATTWHGGYYTHRLKLCSAAPLLSSAQVKNLHAITDDFHIKMIVAALGGLEKLKTMEVE